jgi:antibiotic biosynthesis monooxygenase (ABM) superfamily enzyme
MGIITEIVTMKTIEGVTRDDFINIVDELEKNFHSKQSGFIESELLFNDKTNEWIMIQHWDNLGNLQSASKKMFGNTVTEPFVKSLDPKSVKMLMLPQLGKWDGE